MTFLNCLFKGLHKSPRIIRNEATSRGPGIIGIEDISCLVIPDGCVGLPTIAALEQGIPVIAVKENRNRMQNNLKELPFQEGKLHIVDNYLEAAGLMSAMKAGVSPDSVRRPLQKTTVIESTKTHAAKAPHSNAIKTEELDANYQTKRKRVY